MDTSPSTVDSNVGAGLVVEAGTTAGVSVGEEVALGVVMGITGPDQPLGCFDAIGYWDRRVGMCNGLTVAGEQRSY